MPARVTKTSSGKYRVSTPSGTKAKGTSRAKAERQKRLLNAVDHGWRPSKRRSK